MEMEVPHQLYSLYSASSMIKREDHSRKKTKKPEEKQHDDSKSFTSRNLSKVILPPLGVSSYNQNPVAAKGWIISPMDSRYRYVRSLYREKWTKHEKKIKNQTSRLNYYYHDL